MRFSAPAEETRFFPVVAPDEVRQREPPEQCEEKTCGKRFRLRRGFDPAATVPAHPLSAGT